MSNVENNYADCSSTKVLIIGGGPVGLTTGIALARYGIATEIVEKREVDADESKGLMLSPSSLHVFHALGVLDALELGAYKVGSANLYWQAKRLYRLPFEQLQTPFNYLLMQPQPNTEGVLKRAYLSLGGVYHAGTELISLFESDDQCSLRAEVVCKDRVRSITSRYVVGADGSRSRVRNLLGIESDGESPDFMHFVLGDFIVDWPSGDLTETHYFVNEQGFMIVLPLKPGYHRVFFKGEGSGRHRSALGFDEIAKLVSEIAPKNFKLSAPIWLSTVPHHQKVAKKFACGRAFLAGDAAHSFSPMGGQGMNTGIQDAFNLAWRLAMSIDHGEAPKLLAQYEQERRSVALSTAASVMINTRVICREDKSLQGPLGNLIPARKNVVFIRRKLPMLMAGIGLTYERKEFPSTDSRYHLNDMCGQLVPLKAHARHSLNIFDKLKFTLIYFSNPSDSAYFQELESFVRRYQAVASLTVVGTPNEISTPMAFASRGFIDEGRRLTNEFSVQPGALTLVRPDLVVAWQGSCDTLNILQNYFDRLFPALSASRSAQPVVRSLENLTT